MQGLTQAFAEKALAGAPPLHTRAAEPGAGHQMKHYWATVFSIWVGFD